MADQWDEFADDIAAHPSDALLAHPVFQGLLYARHKVSKKTGISDTFSFDDGMYARYLQTLSDAALHESHRRKVMWVISNMFCTSGLCIAMGPTYGASLVGAALTARTGLVQARKGLLITDELRERGYNIAENAFFCLTDSLKPRVAV